jgi:hypothetical protein
MGDCSDKSEPAGIHKSERSKLEMRQFGLRIIGHCPSVEDDNLTMQFFMPCQGIIPVAPGKRAKRTPPGVVNEKQIKAHLPKIIEIVQLYAPQTEAFTMERELNCNMGKN